MKSRFTPGQVVYLSKGSHFYIRGCRKGTVDDFDERKSLYNIRFCDGPLADDNYWVDSFELFSEDEWKIERTIDRKAFEEYNRQIDLQKKKRDDTFKIMLGVTSLSSYSTQCYTNIIISQRQIQNKRPGPLSRAIRKSYVVVFTQD